MDLSFDDLGLQPQLLAAINKMGFLQPTPIQQEAIPVMASGQDIIGQAQTGTGKTAAFMLPLLQKLDTNQHTIQALVLVPTRELAKQVAEAGIQMAQETSIRILAIYGGQSYTIQTRAINRGVDVLVGTPGRLLDLMKQKIIHLDQVHTLVLDEADEMLEMGFIDDVETILKALSDERQIALFSATMPEAIRKLANRYLQAPQRVSVNPQQVTVAETQQRFYRVREENKLAALMRLLEVEEISSSLIFVRTKARSLELADELSRYGFSVDVLNGDLNQSKREQVLGRFRAHNLKFLVATDVAARGLDIDDVSHVINYDFPQDAEDYVHRIGRTGRAGKTGIAITLLVPRERGRQKEVIAYTHQQVQECLVPTVEEVQGKREERLVQKLSDQLIAGVTPSERQLIEHLGELGMNTVEIAVAAIRWMKAGESKLKNVDLNDLGREPRNKRQEGSHTASRDYKQKWNEGNPRKSYRANDMGKLQEAGMVRLWMNLGGNNGIRPGDVVGAIAGEVGIPGKAIGEITILRDHTLVDISEEHVMRVLRESRGKYQLKGKSVMLREVE